MIPFKQSDARHHPDIDERFHQLNASNICNVVYWWLFLQMAKDVPGDIVECGVGRGRSLLIIAALNEAMEVQEGGGRQIYGYDSFSGFPEPTSRDDSIRKPRQGDWSRSPSGKYAYTAELAQTVLSDGGVTKPVTLITGFFKDTLPRHPDRPVVLLHIDGDLYQSYKDALENLYAKVAPGGIIVFDDFLANENSSEKFPGARLAVKEFLGDSYADLRRSVGGTPYYVKPAA